MVVLHEVGVGVAFIVEVASRGQHWHAVHPVQRSERSRERRHGQLIEVLETACVRQAPRAHACLAQFADDLRDVNRLFLELLLLSNFDQVQGERLCHRTEGLLLPRVAVVEGAVAVFRRPSHREVVLALARLGSFDRLHLLFGFHPVYLREHLLFLLARVVQTGMGP